MDIFRENEIDGNNLLDLSLNDLDYLNITILGHRKTILRGIDDLREKHKVPSKKMNLSQKKPSSAATLIRSQSSSSMDFTSPSDSNVGAEVSYIAYFYYLFSLITFFLIIFLFSLLVY